MSAAAPLPKGIDAGGLREHEVAHHFDDAAQEFESNRFGMWLFLASEIMMFGGLFVGLIVFRGIHPEAFSQGSHHLSWAMGLVNTFLLLTSGYTMAMAVVSAQRADQGKVRLFLLATMALAVGFLIVKSAEYMDKVHHGLFPGKNFQAEGFTDPFVHIFYSFYWVMTGMHGLHVIIGIGLMAWCLMRASRVRFHRNYFTPIEIVGLYWALVDFIWVFLFPLLYLIG